MGAASTNIWTSSRATNPEHRPEFANLTLKEIAARHHVATVLRHGVSVAQLQEFFGTKWDEANRVVKMEFRDYPFVDGQIVAVGCRRRILPGRANRCPDDLRPCQPRGQCGVRLGTAPHREWVTRLLTQHQISPRFPFDELEKMYRRNQRKSAGGGLIPRHCLWVSRPDHGGFSGGEKEKPGLAVSVRLCFPRNKTGEADRAGHSAEVSYLFGTVPRPVDDRPTDSVPN